MSQTLVLTDLRFVPDGAFVFMENTVPWPLDWAIEKATGYPSSHVGFHMFGYVYDAYPPRARKMPLSEYEKELDKWSRQWWTRRLGGLRSFWWDPRGAFTGDELASMYSEAERLLGKPYSLILNWAFGRGEGWLHCSEYCGKIAAASGRVKSDGCRESPGGLLEKLKKLQLEARARV